MKVRILDINNFRGIKRGQIVFNGNALLVGGNNVGKSTVCEALDLLLGPDRLYRRPAIDEHDFLLGRYLDEGEPIVIGLRAVLTELSEEEERRFGNHLRRWDDSKREFVDEDASTIADADRDGVVWALPIIFRGRYDREEDDFEAATFFEHPALDADDLDDDDRESLGGGLEEFSRREKRRCGFIFLRALRTGSRALGLQRGSLLDTVLKLGGDGVAEMWLDTLTRLRDLDPAIGDIERLSDVRKLIRDRMGTFVNLSSSDDATGFFASDLTREHLREVVRLFVATGPSDHPVPFLRQGTGSINLLVFALLTIIADLKGSGSVIFAMEEPEIALPPHTQRRVTRHVLQNMGQTIVTSHSPYVIEQFNPEDVVMLHREPDYVLVGAPIDSGAVKPKTYRTQQRQFAEAILSRAVIVVEGSTEASVLPVASSVLEQVQADYTHLDLAGVSIFNADGDGDVPRYGPIFRALGKIPFGLTDKQASPRTQDAQTRVDSFEVFWESPESGVEKLLTEQVPTVVLRRFLDTVSARSDYPSDQCPYSAETPIEDLKSTAFSVLRQRKGEAHGYAAVLIEQCQTAEELPEFLRTVLVRIDGILKPAANDPEPVAADAGNEQVPDGAEDSTVH